MQMLGMPQGQTATLTWTNLAWPPFRFSVCRYRKMLITSLDCDYTERDKDLEQQGSYGSLA